MEDKKIRVAITHGDTNGIGYELIFKTFDDPAMLELCTPIIYGSPKAAVYHRKVLNLNTQFTIINSANEAKDGRINLLTTYEEETKIDLGQATPESGTAALKALDKAMSDFREEAYDVLVTAPINDSNIKVEGYPFPGDTQYLETCIGEGKKALVILVNEQIRLACLTEGMNIKDVPAAITQENVEEKTRLFFNTLRRDFRISNPRIAILALNPQTSENGKFGKEEENAIIPAIKELADQGVEAFGPYPAEDFFGNGEFTAFDGVMAMYHDQGFAPFKALSPDYGVIYNAGLPLIATASDQTTGYDKAGKDLEDPNNFRHAIYLAIDAFRNRTQYDEAGVHPLGKLYHEKRDESEKSRFGIPKKHSNTPFPDKKPSTASNTKEDHQNTAPTQTTE
ncbi:4-hydroxythreonine-4-phosphate dehydrogenase PdxA [Prevotella cerevisiae]|uniref:4-hydroxythreonine-4-phosphate dehydrogenase PdxA n=1 Tax=Segatella cerevisiae TaxID=2053716 RepID=A0ABT1BV82_9BACT|nr:4-hydroxythreonine-4-phosphate dehydrogenase PdxA [Segatella cerevisiae]MCO6024990.1 4-hydroxythreonine-4-phosphate dehydrogenase PdxA [Segatella cerevisiae]